MRVNPSLLDARLSRGKNQPMVEKVETFGERFEKLRGGMSFQALSDAIYRKTGIRISAQGIHKWSKGGGIEQDKLKLLAEFFGVTEAWLTYGEAPAPTLDEAVGKLPDESRQEVLDFIRYKFSRAEGLIASDVASDYHVMIDRIRKDMEDRLRRDGEKPDEKPK
jgi:hypothetical protein